jgi:hypothetical protein
MDTKFRDEGYAVTLSEEPFGAFLTISKNETVVGQISVGVFSGGLHTAAQIEIRRFVSGELQHITTTDAWLPE